MMSHRNASVEAILRMVQVPRPQPVAKLVYTVLVCLSSKAGSGSTLSAESHAGLAGRRRCSPDPRCSSNRHVPLSPAWLAVQERMSSGPVLSRTSSSSSGMGGMASSSSMQLQLVDDPIPGGFDAAAQQPLKRLDFVRTQGGFWLTWVRARPVQPYPILHTAGRCLVRANGTTALPCHVCGVRQCSHQFASGARPGLLIFAIVHRLVVGSASCPAGLSVVIYPPVD